MKATLTIVKNSFRVGFVEILIIRLILNQNDCNLFIRTVGLSFATDMRNLQIDKLQIY